MGGVLGCLLTAWIIYNVLVVIGRLYLSPLSKIPGPRLAAATPWYETFVDLWYNNFPDALADMHKKYGPIVRPTPWEVSINDPDYYNEVYVTAGKRRTNYDAGSRSGLGMQDAIAITKDHDTHELRRKPVANFFSRPNVTRVESRISDEVRLLDAKLCRLKGTGSILSLDHAFTAYAGDIVVQFTCAEHPRLLDGPDFTPQWHKSICGDLNVVPLFRHIGWLSNLARFVPVGLLRALNPEVAGFRLFTLVGEGQIDKIKKGVAREDEKEGLEKKQSVFHDILRSDLPTSSLITYFVLADPEVKKRLEEELKDITAGFPEVVPRWAELEKLPYLQACIKEGLRINRFFRRNPRISPDPECWIGDYDPRMSRNFVPFTKGSRNCLGMNLGWAELYVCLAALFRPGGHNMSLAGTDESDIVPIFDGDVGAPKRGSKGFNVRFD
ncbi:cytochrome P450 [Aspergillus ellipticus CBS 707.79]|uniref:Cytochrome P450 n=1 Tax=Aspergillus ellipticus CBS 707.79 TaxID=1448320 RepID=A0A319DQN6_9EURO|nr:cytochrome P450 [Aspergillus ellipticus CBS 707.79]